MTSSSTAPDPEPLPLGRARPGAHEHHHYLACSRAVELARDSLRGGTGPVRHVDRLEARAVLLEALEQYAVAISDLGATVPARLRAEIALYARLKNLP